MAAASADVLVLEYHVFVDPSNLAPEGPRDAAEHAAAELLRCRAAAAAIAGRLQPRLRGAAWHREPGLPLWVWDAADSATHAGSSLWGASERRDIETHLWGRVDVGESMDDEWFLVGLLLQVSAEQRDVSISVCDADGELLLIEAAHAIPKWLTPERAPNRVFLRAGALHIVPRRRGVQEDGLCLREALHRLREADRALAMDTSSVARHATRSEHAVRTVF